MVTGVEIAPNNIDLQHMKKELAEKYIKDLKKDLNFLEQSVFFFVEGKVKKLLLQTNTLPGSLTEVQLTKVEKYIVEKLSPEKANKIFTIIKEKQQLLLKAQTKAELEALKSDIVLPLVSEPNIPTQNNESALTPGEAVPGSKDTPSDIKSNGSEDELLTYQERLEGEKGGDGKISGIVIGSGLGADYAQNKLRNRMIENKIGKLEVVLSEGELKKGIQELTKSLEYKIKDPQLLKSQKNQIKKMIDLCKEAEKSTIAMKELNIWKTMVSKNIMSPRLFEICKIDAEGMKVLAEIAKDQNLVTDIAKIKNSTQMSTFLKSKGFTGLSEDVIKVLTETKTVEGVSGVLNVLSKGEQLTKLAKFTKAIPLFDIAYIGVEAYGWATSDYSKMQNTERKANKKSEAAWTHSIRIASIAPALLGAGPIGWVALGVGEAIAQTVEVIAAVKDFYLQDKKDLIMQERTEVKQAIIQSFGGSTWNNLSINEKLCGRFGGMKEGRKLQTVQDAVWANIYLEESIEFPTIANIDRAGTYDSLTPEEKTEYDQEKAKLDSKIESRLGYIKQFLPPDGVHVLQFSNAIKKGAGFAFLEAVITDSRIASRMAGDPTISANGLDEYMKQRGDQLQQENSSVFVALEKVGKENTMELAEFLQRNEYFSSLLTSSDEKVTQEVEPVKDICLYIKKYAERKNIRTSFEQKIRFGGIYDRDDVDTKMCLEGLQDKGLFTMGAHIVNTEEVKTRLIGTMDQKRFAEDFPRSDDMRQNIIYRIAKEFHGYDGINNSEKLQEYFSEKKDVKHGLYYKTGNSLASMGGWSLNVDRDIDTIKLDFFDIEKQSVDDIIAKRFGSIPKSISKEGKPDFLKDKDGNTLYMRGNSAIDSNTETTDGVVNKEFITKIKTILTEEKEASSEANKKKVTEDVTTYVKEHATGGYSKLPYYLVSQAARAGLGQLQYRYFSFEGGIIKAITTNNYISTSIHLPNVQKAYIDNTLLGDAPTDQQIIDAKVIPLTDVDKKTAEIVDAMTERIQKTCGRLDRKSKRGDVLYDPATKEVVSWSKRTKLEQKNGKWMVTDGKYPVLYSSLDEAATVAHMFNRFAADFKKNNPNLSLSYYNSRLGNFGRSKGVYNENGIDTYVITQSFINKSLNETFSSGDNYGAFFKHIENDLA